MAWGASPVDHTFKGASGTNVTSGIDTSGANFIVVGVAEANSNTGVLTDSKSNTWSALTRQLNGSNPAVTIFYAKNAVVGTSHTFTLTGGLFSVLLVEAWTGGDTSAPFDAQNGFGGAGFAGTAQPGSITPAVDGELIICVAGGGGTGFDNCAVDSGMTQGDGSNFAGGVNYSGFIAYKVQGTAAAINPGWAPATGGGNVAVASFKAAAGGATKAPPPFGRQFRPQFYRRKRVA